MRYGSAAEYIFGFGSYLAQPVLAGWRSVKRSVALHSSPCLWKTLHNLEESFFFLLLHGKKKTKKHNRERLQVQHRLQQSAVPKYQRGLHIHVSITSMSHRYHCHTCWVFFSWCLRPFRTQWLPLVPAGGTRSNTEVQVGNRRLLCVKAVSFPTPVGIKR